VGKVGEHAFDDDGRRSMDPDRVSEQADEDALRGEQMSDPVVADRIRRFLGRTGPGDEPGVTAEELPDFLREHNG
jgi:hypothetical protein